MNDFTTSIMNDPILSYMSKQDNKNSPWILFGAELGTGWNSIIKDTLYKMASLDVDKLIIIDQIKEKFGGLRIYFSVSQEDETRDTSVIWMQLNDIVHDAECQAFHTCEICGSTTDVSTRGPGWIRTLCNGCRTKKDNK